MQSEERIHGPQLRGDSASQNIALLTKRERDWLLGKLDLSKSYEYRLKSGIKKKIQTFVNFELPLLIRNNLICCCESESLGKGFGDGTLFKYNSSLGKAKVPGPNPGQGFLVFAKGEKIGEFDDLRILPNMVRSLPNTVSSPNPLSLEPI